MRKRVEYNGPVLAKEMPATTPQQFAVFINTEFAEWAKVIDKSGARDN